MFASRFHCCVSLVLIGFAWGGLVQQSAAQDNADLFDGFNAIDQAAEDLSGGKEDGPAHEMPYRMTRMEWLGVYLNSTYQIDNMHTHGYRIRYACPPNSDTVILHVAHYEDVDRIALNSSVNLARQMVKRYAQSKRWNWVKISEKFVPSPRPSASGPAAVVATDRPVATTPDKSEIADAIKDALRDALIELKKEQSAESLEP